MGVVMRRKTTGKKGHHVREAMTKKRSPLLQEKGLHQQLPLRVTPTLVTPLSPRKLLNNLQRFSKFPCKFRNSVSMCRTGNKRNSYSMSIFFSASIYYKFPRRMPETIQSKIRSGYTPIKFSRSKETNSGKSSEWYIAETSRTLIGECYKAKAERIENVMDQNNHRRSQNFHCGPAFYFTS